jgi:nucleoid DNA-binding protein
MSDWKVSWPSTAIKIKPSKKIAFQPARGLKEAV